MFNHPSVNAYLTGDVGVVKFNHPSVNAYLTGEVGVVMFNHASVDYAVKLSDRIAQLVLERIFTPPVIEVLSAACY